jgi:hypothetical protein
VFEPGGDFRFLVNSVQGTTGAVVRLPVRVRNTTSAWFDSFFPQHPVTATYRWLDLAGNVVVANGMRTYFPAPVRPGATAVLDLVVQLPARPGAYVLLGGLVQEAFAWFHDVDGALADRIAATVT